MNITINTVADLAQCILATCYKDGVRNILYGDGYDRTAVMEIYEISNQSKTGGI